MIDKKYRRMMIECPKVIRSAHLTDQQIEVYKHVKAHCAPRRSNDISSSFGISVQHASITLRLLTEKGYLSREYGSAPSGGLEYVYVDALYDR